MDSIREYEAYRTPQKASSSARIFFIGSPCLFPFYQFAVKKYEPEILVDPGLLQYAEPFRFGRFIDWRPETCDDIGSGHVEDDLSREDRLCLETRDLVGPDIVFPSLNQGHMRLVLGFILVHAQRGPFPYPVCRLAAADKIFARVEFVLACNLEEFFLVYHKIRKDRVLHHTGA